ANVWYSWDVTPGAVRHATDGSVTYAVGLRTLETKGEEQVVFAAREAGRNAPRLMLALAPSASTIPLWAVPVAALAVALLAFGGGILLGRRRRSARAAGYQPRKPAPEVARAIAGKAIAATGSEELDAIIDGPASK